MNPENPEGEAEVQIIAIVQTIGKDAAGVVNLEGAGAEVEVMKDTDQEVERENINTEVAAGVGKSKVEMIEVGVVVMILLEVATHASINTKSIRKTRNTRGGRNRNKMMNLKQLLKKKKDDHFGLRFTNDPMKFLGATFGSVQVQY